MPTTIPSKIGKWAKGKGLRVWNSKTQKEEMVIRGRRASHTKKENRGDDIAQKRMRQNNRVPSHLIVTNQKTKSGKGYRIIEPTS